jgi:hypothetical protein
MRKQPRNPARFDAGNPEFQRLAAEYRAAVASEDATATEAAGARVRAWTQGAGARPCLPAGHGHRASRSAKRGFPDPGCAALRARFVDPSQWRAK